MNKITLSAKHTIETALMNSTIQLVPTTEESERMSILQRNQRDMILEQLQNAQRELDKMFVIEEPQA